MTRTIVALVIAACVLAKQVHAAGGPSMTVDRLQSLLGRDMPGFVGFTMGAAQLSDVDHPQNFCIPSGKANEIPNTVIQYMKDMYLAAGAGNRRSEFGNSNAAIMVIIALSSAFPCKPQQ